MGKVYSVNNRVSTGAEAIFVLKTTLKNAGWTVVSSGDSLTYDSGADIITHAGSGAGGMANTRAWFRIQEPNGEREFTIQRGTTNLVWRVKYSTALKFVGGSPNATTTPTAGDGQILMGGGSDASPTYSTWFGADGAYMYHVVAQTEPLSNGIGAAYGFHAWDTLNGIGENRGGFFLEPMAPGSYAECVGPRTSPTEGDADPVVIFIGYLTSDIGFRNNVDSTGSLTTTAGFAYCWYKYGFPEASFGSMFANRIGDSFSGNWLFAPGGVGNSGYDGRTELQMVFWGHNFNRSYDSRVGTKGISGLVRLRSEVAYAIAYPNTFNLNTDSAMISASDLVIPWPTGVLPA